MDISTLPILPTRKIKRPTKAELEKDASDEYSKRRSSTRRRDGVTGKWYNYKGNIRWWTGKRLENQKKIKERRDKPENKERRKKYYRKYGKEEKEKRKKYYEKNKERLKQERETKEYKEKRNKRRKERRDTDPIYKKNCIISSSIRRCGIKQTRTETAMEYLGCEPEFFHNHLEKQFLPDMTWENHSNNGWHMDHRKPKHEFDFSQEEDYYRCWHWTNIQPMWGSENMSKKDYFDEETFTHVWIDRDIGWIPKN